MKPKADTMMGGYSYTVVVIKKSDAVPWLKLKHYAKRVPSLTFCFGLYRNKNLVGVCTFGKPPSPSLCIGVCGEKYSDRVFEFNRLCLEDNKKNEASFFVGKALKLLPKPKILISYADTAQGHIGYIYQATNWIYTGAVTAHAAEFVVNGKKTHERSLGHRGITAPKKWAEQNNVTRIKPKPKNRYIYFLGSKKEKKEMLLNLRYPILPYPKGETKRYDTSKKFEKQTQVFV